MGEIESAIIGMGDVEMLIDTLDNYLCEKDAERAERAMIVLREVFGARLQGLRSQFYSVLKGAE